MNKLFLYIVLFFSTVSNHVYSNSQSDSLRLVWQNEELLDSTRFEALDEYYDLYVHVIPDSVLSSLNFYYDLALEKKAERQIYRALLRQGNIYRNQNKKDEALNQYRLARNVAEKANLSIDGVGSSLRRMYEYFAIRETKYKKIALLHKVIKISQSN